MHFLFVLTKKRVCCQGLCVFSFHGSVERPLILEKEISNLDEKNCFLGS